MQVTSGIQCNLLSPSYSTIYAPQGDAQSRFVLIQLLEGATPWEVPAGASVIIRAAKPDGTFCFYDTNEAEESAYSVSGSTVTIELVGQVLAAPGPVLMQVDFYNADGAHLSTFTFCCQVSESVVSDEDIVSSDYFSVLTATLTEMQQIEQAVKAAYGAPLVAATAAAMTDHTRVYVYTGSESGYINGNWYYWNGTAWASGGVYNSSAINVDSAPTEGSTNPVSSGGTYTAIANEAAAREAADTALGDELDDVKSALTDITGINSSYNWIIGKRIKTSGDTVDYSNPESSAAYNCLVVDCSAGDVFTLTGQATSSAYRLWCWCRTDGTVVSKPNTNLNYTLKKITAPADATKLIVNVNTTYKYALYNGEIITPQLESLRDGYLGTNAYYGDIISSPSLIDNNNWIAGGYFNSASGDIIENENYRYQFIRVQKAGSYTTYRDSSFGTNRYKLPLFDEGKKYVKTVTGEADANNADIVYFSITSGDLADGVRYIGASTKSDTDITLSYGTKYLPASDFPTPDWTIQHALYANRTALGNDIISLNANYFDPDKAEWNNGYILPLTGSVVNNSDYIYTYVPLRGAGTYIALIPSGTFGVNSHYFPLFDINKRYISAKSPDSYDGSINKYTLTDEDCIDAAYTVMQKSATGSFIPKLFYNSVFTDVTTFPIDGTVPLAPKYSTGSDPLYKKIIVCDGDSICKGAQDKPYNWESWYGRFLRGYQITGKNYGVNGGTIMDKTNTTVSGNPRHSVCMTIDTIHAEYPSLDYLILEGGTNDADLVGRFMDDTPPTDFGTWSETDFSGNYDPTTFCGGVEYLFYRAVNYYPHAKIGFIIAMEMGTANNAVENRRRYFDEIIRIAEKWHIPVLDLWKLSHADARLAAYYDPTMTGNENVAAQKFYYDGQHPTSYGYNLMQPIIEAWIKTL